MNGLKPLLVEKYQELVKLCLAKGINISMSQGYRSIADQNVLYAQGRTTPGSIVTDAKGGQSMHNYGVAFDVCPVDSSGNFNWNASDFLWNEIGTAGQSLGLEWGGTWAGLVDKPHFQMVFGHPYQDFEANTVNWSLWNVSPLETPPVAPQTPSQPVPDTPQVASLKAQLVSLMKQLVAALQAKLNK